MFDLQHNTLLDDDIPLPVAPARLGGTIAGVWNGHDVTVDSLGNIFDRTGNHIGVAPGTKADVGSTGTTPPIVNTPSTGSVWNTIKNGALQVSSGGIAGANANGDVTLFGISLEDFLFIVVGLILIAASLFSFKGTTEVVQSFAKGVTEGAKTAIP